MLGSVLAPRQFRHSVYVTFNFCGLQGVFGAFFVAYLVDSLGISMAAIAVAYSFLNTA